MGDTKEARIESIRHRQITLVFDEARLGDMRVQMAAALQTKAGLEASKPEHRSALARVALGFGSAALGFGVATEALGDAASLAAIRSSFLGNQVSHFLKNAEVRRVMEQNQLCWNGQGRDPLSRKPLLAASLPLLAGGAATYGLLNVTQQMGAKPAGDALPSITEGAKGPDATPQYDDAALEAMSEEDLKKIETDLSRRLSQVAKAQSQLGDELKGVQKKVIALHFSGAKKGDLAKVSDEELHALARKVVASGHGKDNESFLESFGVWDGLGVFAGFGFGTKILHGMYDGLAPWRPYVRSGMAQLSEQARSGVEELVAQGVLTPCRKAPEAAKAAEAAPKEVSLRDFTEADYANLLETWAPTESGEAADWSSVPGNLASFFSAYRFETPAAEDRWKWNQLLEEAADSLAKRYARNPAEDRSIRETVGKFASAYRESGYTYGTELNLLKWSMQGYVADLERGRIPSEVEVDGVLALTKTDRLENGAAAAYFKILNLAHEVPNKPKAFEDARQAYWRQIDQWTAVDEQPAVPAAKPKVTIYLPFPDVGIARMLATLLAGDAAAAGAASGAWEGALAGAI